MRLNWLLAPLLVLGLGLASVGARDANAASFERPVSGLVSKVYALSRTVYLGSEGFIVPADVYDLGELAEGTNAVITFENSGGRRVARSLEVDPNTN